MKGSTPMISRNFFVPGITQICAIALPVFAADRGRRQAQRCGDGRTERHELNAVAAAYGGIRLEGGTQRWRLQSGDPLENTSMTCRGIPCTDNGIIDHRLLWATWIALAGLLAISFGVSAEDGIPRDSVIARAAHDRQRLLLNPMDDAASVATGAWKMKGTYVTTAERDPAETGLDCIDVGGCRSGAGGSER